MSPKLDPRLLELLESTSATSTPTRLIDVLVGLDTPLTPELRDDLGRRGLSVRTDASTVLTGTVALHDLARLAESPRVQQIELSAPLYTEHPRRNVGEGPAE